MEAIEKLKLLTAWDLEPVLSEAELGEALANYAIADSQALAPVNEEWSPTYNLNAAAAHAWMIKAARAAATVEIDPPLSGIVTSKVFENCRSMARIFAAKGTGNVSIR